MELENNAKSKSLASGVVKRQVKNILSHQDRYLKSRQLPLTDYDLIDQHVQLEIRKIKGNFSRKGAFPALKVIGLDALYCLQSYCFYCSNYNVVTANTPVEQIYGLSIRYINNKPHVIPKFIICAAKSHKSILQDGIHFTVHVLERIVLRSNHEYFFKAIFKLNKMLCSLEEYYDVEEGNRLELYIWDIGLFVLERINNTLVIVTFVAEKMLSDTQLQEASGFRNALKGKNKSLFDEINLYIAQLKDESPTTSFEETNPELMIADALIGR